MSRPTAPRPATGRGPARPASPVRSPAAPARPPASRPPAARPPAARPPDGGAPARSSAARSSAAGFARRSIARVVRVGPSDARPPGGAIGGAPPWVSGLLAGLQAAVLSLLVVVTPALAAYVATSADPANAEIGWPRSVVVGAALWLMGHGGSLVVDGATVSIVPLGLTALALFSAHASARRSAQPTTSAWLAGVGGYLAVAVGVLLLVGRAGPLGAGGASVARTVLGAAAVALVGLGSGTLDRARWRELSRPVWSRIPDAARAGVRGGVMVTALLVAGAGLVTATWAVSGRAATGDVVAGLGLDTFSGLLLAVAQLFVAPNLVLWAVGWLAGPGFAVGSGTLFAPSEVVSGPLPALPLLGALPADGSAIGRWVPLVVVLAGALAGWWLHRRLTATTWRRPFGAAACAALVAGGATGLLVAAAGGSAGPGRLAVVGASGPGVGLVVAGLSLVGLLVVAVPADAAVRAAVRGWGRAAPRAVDDERSDPAAEHAGAGVRANDPDPVSR